MKSIRLILLALVVSVSSVFAADWEIDKSHSSMNFAVKHLLINTTRGEFKDYSGTVSLDPKDLSTAKVNITVDVNSIDTREEKRDNHLKSEDFFDAANFPTMTFVSKSAKQTAPGKGTVTGDLTIRGTTKEVTFDLEGFNQEVTTAWGFVAIGGTAKTKINRFDFGLHWNAALETGGLIAGDEVTIECEFELRRPVQ